MPVTPAVTPAFGFGGVAGGEEDHWEKTIKKESGRHCSDDVQEGINNVEERGGDEPDGGVNGEHQEAGSTNNVQVNTLMVMGLI
jgi:hypothetical protein